MMTMNIMKVSIMMMSIGLAVGLAVAVIIIWIVVIVMTVMHDSYAMIRNKSIMYLHSKLRNCLLQDPHLPKE